MRRLVSVRCVATAYISSHPELVAPARAHPISLRFHHLPAAAVHGPVDVSTHHLKHSGVSADGQSSYW